MLHLARLVEDEAHDRGAQPGVRRERVRTRLLGLHPAQRAEHVFGERPVHVIAPERAVASGRFDLKYAVVEQQRRDVERPATEIVDCEVPAAVFVEPVGQRGGGRLVEQPEHVEPCETAGVFRSLSLRVVEVRGHGDHDAAYAAKLVFGAALELAKDLGADLDGIDDAAAADPKAHDVRLSRRRRNEVIRPEPARLGVIGAPAHEALDAHDGVAGALERVLLRDRAHDDFVVIVGNHAREQHLTIAIGDGERLVVFHVSHQRVGGAEVDADGARRSFGVENLEEHKGAFFQAVDAQSERSSRMACASSMKRR